MLPPVSPTKPAPQTSALYAAAQELEAQFLAEMLRAAGFGEARSALGGGAGEQHFTSLLTDEYAHALAQRGGLGLQQRLVESLMGTGHAAR